eukprot:5981667-Pyramimonas_sp.AAC.1
MGNRLRRERASKGTPRRHRSSAGGCASWGVPAGGKSRRSLGAKALAPCGVSGKILKSVTNGCSAMELCCGRSRTRLQQLTSA